MNEKLNLVEILKNCPKGTKLYSTIYGEVKLTMIGYGTYPIGLENSSGDNLWATKDGKFIDNLNDECTLFPSKNQRDWSKFNPKKCWFVPPCEFKDGDIVATNSGSRVFILQMAYSDVKGYCYVGYDFEFNEFFFSCKRFDRLASEEEKQKLFDAIKEQGYKWNAETKILEKLVITKFDPRTLKAFDKVLFRDSIDMPWTCGIFSHANFELFYPFKVGRCLYKCCIPYNEDTKHLVGSKDEAPEYYRYWED